MTDLLPPACVVRSLQQARVAVGAGQPVTLISAPGAGLFAGPMFWLALVRTLREEARAACVDILDCADAPGRALEAIRLGQRIMVLDPNCVGFADVAARAVAWGARVLTARPASLDLGRRGASRHLADWLAGHDSGSASV